MKIIDLKCAIIGKSPVVRIITDEGISGFGQAEWAKPYLKPFVLFYKSQLLGEDPTNVESVMRKIRRHGGFKPYGSAVSAIEVALWDIAGKAANLPIYKLLGGKVRDRVLVYNGGIRFPIEGKDSPESFAENTLKMKNLKEGFSIIKQGIAVHGEFASNFKDYFYGDVNWVENNSIVFDDDSKEWQGISQYIPNGGQITEKGFNYTIECIKAMKDVLGDEVGLALDLGPGINPSDALKIAKAVEDLNIMWLEDMITGDYTPYVLADLYRDVTINTTTPIHTGEQIYLRHNFKDLIDKRAVNVIGPDPLDVGGLAETKWIAEHADMNGIMIAPHGTIDGLIGLAAQVQLAATLPKNYIAFEYCVPCHNWWYDIVDGLPNPIVKDSYIDVWDTPGLGISFNEKAKNYLREEDKDFFD
ncbi:MAG: mandelate racemase/muconate lactonizing enzyme family protein [Dehalococcoidia bacterium]|tara:strand:- start:957 stop:2201 length:1245 start_codon:yes stop_codon:yes gene_type:complete